VLDLARETHESREKEIAQQVKLWGERSACLCSDPASDALALQQLALFIYDN
jgi:hypothetical protein